VAENGVIGRAGALPWHLPEDLRHFRAVTMGHTILMGRRTWQSIGRPLPGRRMIVVTRGPGPPGVEVAASLAEAVGLARSTDPEPRIVGGAQLYREALPIATRLLWTAVSGCPDGDTTFPDVSWSDWRLIDERPGVGVVFREWIRAGSIASPAGAPA
jgi:dihydrofolate reductase